MDKLCTIVNEMQISKLPSDTLLDWFRQRVNHTFIFFDTETTGIDRIPEKGGINQLTQISALATKINSETFDFNEIGRFNINIKLNDDLLNQMKDEPDSPDVNSPEYSKWMFNTKKGILVYNHYDLANSESYEEERKALETFDNFLKNYNDVTLIAHNAPFDLRWIQFHELFIESTYEIIDTYDFFKNFFFPTLHKLASEQAKYQYKYDKFLTNKDGQKSWSLKNLVPAFHNEVNQLKNKLANAHNAIVDCEMTMAVFEHGLKLIKPFI